MVFVKILLYHIKANHASTFLVEKRSYAKFDVFLIYFGTSTFDEIAKDTKMKLETMVGVIGGTCGLLTGFSVLSGVEILYYATLFLVSIISGKVGRCHLTNHSVI